MRVLITGGGGLVASALAPRFDEVFALRHAAFDITNRQAVDDVVERIRPGLIINTAVIGVDECERNPGLAKSVNTDGPEFLAQAAARIESAIVHFSSNYVFDGHPSPREPYTVDDEARPINVYGRTKLEGERAVAANCSKSFVIRTSWVYGPNKQSFLATVAAKLKRGESVQAISDTWASCTYIADLADRVVHLLERESYGLHHVANDGVCSYETFARAAATLAGLPDEVAKRLIDVVSEAEMNREAPRPPWTPMRCDPPMRPWQEALADYVTGAPR